MTPMLKQLVQPIGEKNVGIKLKKLLLKTVCTSVTASSIRELKDSSAKEETDSPSFLQ
jgi:hypothetical protein